MNIMFVYIKCLIYIFIYININDKGLKTINLKIKIFYLLFYLLNFNFICLIKLIKIE
ncbi:hypothetical protein BCR36DRAFT_54428 [Piromyces finnis]|uniref:Uncharacterized protein n=1 Tax=Piromyces finnis TaxID=1754191 RepID=A0A1Y1VBN4_9FUNG|nr:hypothetical protein BCR36DRAFT_54428 [Piromyces finnis]|eukprot:ORX50666.1 hypothetical protein BCR36DRAFT_54428 [Piromyces finnis]